MGAAVCYYEYQDSVKDRLKYKLFFALMRISIPVTTIREGREANNLDKGYDVECRSDEQTIICRRVIINFFWTRSL